MKPYSVNLWVYADNEDEVSELQKALNAFSVEKYNQHIYPRATSIQRLINQFGNSAIVNNYLR